MQVIHTSAEVLQTTWRSTMLQTFEGFTNFLRFSAKETSREAAEVCSGTNFWRDCRSLQKLESPAWRSTMMHTTEEVAALSRGFTDLTGLHRLQLCTPSYRLAEVQMSKEAADLYGVLHWFRHQRRLQTSAEVLQTSWRFIAMHTSEEVGDICKGWQGCRSLQRLVTSQCFFFTICIDNNTWWFHQENIVNGTFTFPWWNLNKCWIWNWI